MKLLSVVALILLAPCTVWATEDAADDVVASTDEAATKAEKETPKVIKSNISANFNPDRTEAWGDVELVGGGQGWEFVKGTFGSEVHCHPMRLVFAEPENGCSEIENDVNGAIVAIQRGNCSFADKAAYAQQAGAKGVIVVNSGEALSRMPAGWMKFPKQVLIDLPVVMVRATAGVALKKILHREPITYAQFVAKHWTVSGEYQTGHCAESVLMEEEEVSFDGEVALNNLELGAEGGKVEHTGADAGAPSVFEYLLGSFGGPRPTTTRELVWADPADACTPLKEGADLRAKFVLSKRGGCPFTIKARNIEIAGGFGAVVINNAPVLVQMAKGDAPDDFVTIPAGMVTSTAGEYLEAALKKNDNIRLSFQKFDVQARFWDGLKDIKSPQKWPSDHEEREKLYHKLRNIHSPEHSPTGGRERFEYLNSLYQQATQYWGASV